MIGFIILAAILLIVLVALIGYAKTYERQMAKIQAEKPRGPIFHVIDGPEGYIILKGDEYFITCTGSHEDAVHIAETLNKECQHEQM